MESGNGAKDTDEAGAQERLARRAALARTIRRRRIIAVATLVAIVSVALLTLTRPGTGGSPPTRDATAAPPSPAIRTADEARAAARLAADDVVVDSVLAYTGYVSRGSRKAKEIALTFDDGPGPTTPALLRYLVANGVPATFFLVGSAITKHPRLVRQEADAGFTLGTHTEDHARLATRSPDVQGEQILDTADRITRFTGHSVRFFRPPYGSFDAQTLGILKAERMLMVLWSLDPRDFALKRAAPIVDATLAGARGGSIVLLHDGPGARPQTLKAVRRIVPELRSRGFRFVSLPTLLRDDPPPRNQPLPRSLAG
jgi:peptidoglycan/xylan/chitin deacetylase (PgdA/CDA1 family)